LLYKTETVYLVQNNSVSQCRHDETFILAKLLVQLHEDRMRIC